MTVLQARAHAQSLAFGPIVFQAVRLLWKMGILESINYSGEDGATAADITERTGVSAYGVGVLCEVGVSSETLNETDGRFSLTKVGSMLLYDKLTQVNVDFVHDVCYQGMYHLEESIRESRPAGLKVFSDTNTIYQCVTDLPSAAKQSWYNFDHYYSDRAFGDASTIVFGNPVGRLLDVGGNTGRWAKHCLEKNNRVEVTIADLPGQLALAQEMLNRSPHAARAAYHEVDLLGDAVSFPGNFDVVWMSQFLDCFSEEQIAQILIALKPALQPNGRIYIMETLVDRQRFQAASYSLNATSLYFTALANGNSRMYRGSTIENILARTGYRVEANHDNLGIGHTLLECCAV